jgi:2-alkyl-3-oxoalkanoate reductase
MQVFIAGASGVIGVRLVRRLLERGHTVTATTTSAAKAPQLRAMGARTALLDGLDARMVDQTVASASPDAVVHQMTALAGTPDPKHVDRWFAKTNRLRTEGTDNLLAAAAAVGAAHVVAQSYSGWPNERRGAWVKSEEDPLDDSPPAAQQRSLAAIKHLEKAVLEAPIIGTVLRYGALYGPGASDELVTQGQTAQVSGCRRWRGGFLVVAHRRRGVSHNRRTRATDLGNLQHRR